jgi:hypothetical protein
MSSADMDRELTRQTRRALVERSEREEILVAAGHFEAPGFGRIVRREGRRYWRGLWQRAPPPGAALPERPGTAPGPGG